MNRVPALLGAFLMGMALSASASAERAAEGPTIAIEMYVEPALALRAPEMNPDQYEAYLRELFRGIVPEAPLVAGQGRMRDASHVVVVDFSSTEERGMARVTVSVKLGRGVTRRMELARVASTIVVATDAAAVEAFLRQQATRVIVLYRLRQSGDATVPSGESCSVPAAELGMTLVINERVHGPAAEAVSSAIRTTLAAELPGITLVGPFGPGEDGGRTRPMLAVEFARALEPDLGGMSGSAVWSARNRVRIVLTDRERGELFRADEVYDDGDAERALRFLRETMRTVAGKLLEDPLLFPLVPPASAGVPESAPIPIDREWEDAPGPQRSENPPAAPVATARRPPSPAPPPPRSSWRRPWRIGALSGAGVGLVALGIGTWQGIAAKRAESDYRHAEAQLDALDAKRRSEVAGARANVWLGVSGAVTAIAATVFALDVLGIIGERPSGRTETQPATVDIGATPGAFVVTGAFSLP